MLLKESIAERLDDIENSQQTYFVRGSSQQKKEVADELQSTLLNDIEELEMDLAWSVLDIYAEAMMISRGLDGNGACMESEAVASTAIGCFTTKF